MIIKASSENPLPKPQITCQDTTKIPQDTNKKYQTGMEWRTAQKAEASIEFWQQRKQVEIILIRIFIFDSGLAGSLESDSPPLFPLLASNSLSGGARSESAKAV